MTPATIQYEPPAGYRFMFAHEAERLAHGNEVVLFNGEINHGTVRSFGDTTMTVELRRSGALVTLDLDDPDFWPDAEVRDRRPPMDPTGEFVALRDTNAAITPDEEIEPLLRTGVALAGLAKNDPELAAALAEVRRILMDRLIKQRAA